MKNEHVTSISVTLLILVLGLSFFIPKEIIKEEPNKITGKATSDTTVYIIPSENYTCNTTIQSGWSTLAFPCLIGTLSESEMESEFSNLDKAFYYVGGNVDPWQSYKRSLPSWVRVDFPEISRTGGYVMYFTANESFIYEGQIANETNLTLSEGWRLAGYTSQTVRLAAIAFESLNGSYNLVRKLNGSSNLTIADYEYFDPNDIAGSTFNQTFPIDAFWINITTADVWTVNK